MLRKKSFFYIATVSSVLAVFSLSGFREEPNAFINIQEKMISRVSLPAWSGKASWYSKESPGINQHTANNEIFDDSALTCAMWNVPFNQWIKVTNKANGKYVIVRVNDRGPHRRYVRKGRIIDLTQAAFARISSLKKGLIDIELEFL